MRYSSEAIRFSGDRLAQSRRRRLLARRRHWSRRSLLAGSATRPAAYGIADRPAAGSRGVQALPAPVALPLDLAAFADTLEDLARAALLRSWSVAPCRPGPGESRTAATWLASGLPEVLPVRPVTESGLPLCWPYCRVCLLGARNPVFQFSRLRDRLCQPCRTRRPSLRPWHPVRSSCLHTRGNSVCSPRPHGLPAGRTARGWPGPGRRPLCDGRYHASRVALRRLRRQTRCRSRHDRLRRLRRRPRHEHSNSGSHSMHDCASPSTPSCPSKPPRRDRRRTRSSRWRAPPRRGNRDRRHREDRQATTTARRPTRGHRRAHRPHCGLTGSTRMTSRSTITFCCSVDFRFPASAALFRSFWTVSMTSACWARKASPTFWVQSSFWLIIESTSGNGTRAFTLASHGCLLQGFVQFVPLQVLVLLDPAVRHHQFQGIGGGDEDLGKERIRVQCDGCQHLVQLLLGELLRRCLAILGKDRRRHRHQQDQEPDKNIS